MSDNQNVKIHLQEALNKVEDIFLNIQKNIKLLNGLFISQLQEEIKDNDKYIYNEIETSKKLEYDDEVIKALFLENVGFEVSNLDEEIIKKDSIYCHTITNLKGLKRVILAKIRQKDLKYILTMNDFKYYEDRVFNNLYDFKELIYRKIKHLMEVKTSGLFPFDDLNNFYTIILNNLTTLKEIFLSNIDERGC